MKIIASRKSNIDFLETIAMFFVVIYHTVSDIDFDVMSNDTISVRFHYCVRSILSVSVPLFFVCNGYLLFHRNFNLQRHIHKILRIISIALFWSAASAAFSSYVIHYVEPVNNWKLFLSQIWFTQPSYNNHIWFLHTLIIIYIFFPFLKLAFDKAKPIFHFGFIIVMILVFGNTTLGEIASLATGKNFEYFNFIGPMNPITMSCPFSLGYFLLGSVLGSYNDKIIQFLNKHSFYILPSIIVLICIMCFLLGLYGISFSHVLGRTWDNMFYGYGTLFTLVNVCLIYVLSLLYSYKPSDGIIHRLVYLVSVNSLGIYLLQDFAIKAYAVYVYPKLSAIGLIDNYLEKLLLCAALTFICLVISILLSRIPGFRRLI